MTRRFFQIADSRVMSTQLIAHRGPSEKWWLLEKELTG
jgi:hypothetical protein